MVGADVLAIWPPIASASCVSCLSSWSHKCVIIACTCSRLLIVSLLTIDDAVRISTLVAHLACELDVSKAMLFLDFI